MAAAPSSDARVLRLYSINRNPKHRDGNSVRVRIRSPTLRPWGRTSIAHLEMIPEFGRFVDFAEVGSCRLVPHWLPDDRRLEALEPLFSRQGAVYGSRHCDALGIRGNRSLRGADVPLQFCTITGGGAHPRAQPQPRGGLESRLRQWRPARRERPLLRT